MILNTLLLRMLFRVFVPEPQPLQTDLAIKQ